MFILSIISIIFQILVAWLLADFITGIVHWWEDRYLDSENSSGFLKSIAEDNELHHKKPTAMTQSTGWSNIQSSVIFAFPIAFIMWITGFPLWLWLAVFFAGFGNLIHRWSHMPDRKLPYIIIFMQWTGLFISQDHHDQHHRSMNKLIPKHLSGFKFCPMTDWVNPILDKIKFWDRLEKLLDYFGFKVIKK
jgi:ubiquitin-conjugating enzyme E2 variant